MKRKLWISAVINIILAGCLVFLLFFYEGTPEAPKPEGEAGGGAATAANPEEIVNQNCISCHGDNLQGGAGPALNKVGSKYSAEDIEGIITNGKGAMPSGLVSGEEAAAIAEWLSQKK